MGKSKGRKEKKRNEKELRENSDMHLVGYLLLEALPINLRKMFQQVINFQAYELSSYSSKAPSTSSQAAWRSQKLARALKIASKVHETREEGEASEMEWRVRIEDLVLERLTLEIYW